MAEQYDQRKKDKIRYKFAYSRTKATVAFVLSVVFSTLLTPYFNRYLGVILGNAKVVAKDVVLEELHGSYSREAILLPSTGTSKLRSSELSEGVADLREQVRKVRGDE